MFGPITQAITLVKTLYEDQPTRDMLETFAKDYYLSQTPLMVAKQVTEVIGGMLPAIMVAAVSGNPELVPAEVAGEAGTDITGVATTANKIADTLEDLKHTRDIEQAEVDQIHVLKAQEATLAKYMKEVETLDVTSPKDGAVFYSGPGNRELADTFAEQPGMTTLEMTPGGSYLDNEELFDQLPRHMAITPWRPLSERYAQQAFGKVYAFTKGATDTGVFNQYELPSLLSNPNVTDIIYKEEIGGTGDE